MDTAADLIVRSAFLLFFNLIVTNYIKGMGYTYSKGKGGI